MYLGVDLGTSSVKVLLSNENGCILASSTKDYPLYFPQENYSEQNPSDWLKGTVDALKEIGKSYQLSNIKGVSFSGQMHGLVILDKDDNVIRPSILWNDNRTIKECEYLNDVIGKDNLIKYTGNIALTGFTAPKLLWVKENEPDNFNKIAKIMLPKDYLAYMMSGQFTTDYSDASGTLYLDVKGKKWSKRMLEILHIKEEQLPKLYNSYDVVGTVSEKFNKLTGLSKDCKVIIGGGDQAVGAIGTGTIEDGELCISLGTSGVVFCSSDKFLLDKKARVHSFCHANGCYHVMGVTLSAAGSLKWWTDEIIKNKDTAKVLSGCDKLELDEDLLFLPYINGERSPINDPNAKGVFYGVKINHKQKDITNAIIEGVSFSLLDCKNAIQDLNIECKKAKVIGGGAKSEIWLQMMADMLGIKIQTINTVDGGGLGAIILAMVGCGQYATVKDACDKIIAVTKEYMPNKERTSFYATKYKKFKKVYDKLKDFH